MPIVSLPLTSGASENTGLNFDLNASECPARAWTSGRNVRFSLQGILPTKNDSLIVTSGSTFHSLFPATDSGTAGPLWVLGGNTSIYALDNTTLTDITRVSGAYTGTAANRWVGTNMNGLLFLTNGVDKPQVWNPTTPATKLIDLPNWQATVRCAGIRSFKNFLLAFNILKGAVPYGSMVKWAHPADPGLVPPSWDETDPTKDAGEYSLSETPGKVMDIVPMRDLAIVYKEDSVWTMQYIGGAYIFKFAKLFDSFGIPQRNCAIEFLPGQHMCFTGDDLVIHNGQQSVSIAEGRIRSYLKTLTYQQTLSSFLVVNQQETEVWLCLNTGDASTRLVDKAIIYNWMTKSIGIRDLTAVAAIDSGRIVGTLPAWGTIATTWKSESRLWSEVGQTDSLSKLLGLRGMSVYQFDCSNYRENSTLIERTGIGIPFRANTPPDTTTMKFLSRLWLRVIGREGDTLSVTLGSQAETDQGIVWKTAKQYIIGSTKKLDFTLSGRLFAIRIESTNGYPWILLGIDAEVEKAGDN